MESAKTEDEKLQMFFDGELAPEEEAALRRDLEGSAEGQAQLREWEQIRGAMKSVSSDWAGALDSDALFARIESDIQAALQTLPEHHRAVIVLREIDGMSYEQMAEALEVPQGPVMSRLFHARQKMQAALAPSLSGEKGSED